MWYCRLFLFFLLLLPASYSGAKVAYSKYGITQMPDSAAQEQGASLLAG